MKSFAKAAGFGLPLLLVAAGAFSSPAAAQNPISPIIVDTAVPIIINAIKPQPKATGLARFDGYVQNANIAQITVRARGNDMALQTFPLSEAASVKMQQVIDKG